MNKKSSSVIEEKLNSALVSRQKNNFRDAEKLYREVLEADSNNFQATFSLGTIFLQHEKFDEAREFFLKAILRRFGKLWEAIRRPAFFFQFSMRISFLEK